MNKTMVCALVMLVLVVMVLLLNRGSVGVHVGFAEFSVMKSFAFLGFTAVGVLIGVMLR